MFFFAMTILSSATLLFLIEPMIARYILPWFGGGPSIWSTCMLFFQLFLLGGYAYAHFIGTRLSPRRQGWVHIAVLLLSLCFLPITPHESWKPLTTPLHPALNIIGLLGVTIGLPFGLLSSSSPLHMHWFSRSYPGRAPYRLYALSNIGSILGLMLYPFVLEPLLTLRAQTWIWSGAYILFVLSSGLCALRLIQQEPATGLLMATAAEPQPPSVPQSQPAPHAHLGAWNPILWIILSACGSVMLLATTNQLCQEVAVIPFLWIIPLTLYLLSFILCFESERWYNRYVWGSALLLGAAAILWLLFSNQVVHVFIQIGILTFTLFAVCMTCHGELVRIKPPAERLTAFYLMVSVGGALGGLFVNFAAPHIFKGFWEFHIGLFLAFMLFGVLVVRSQPLFKKGWLITLPVAAVLGAVAYLLIKYDPFHLAQKNFGPQFLKTPAGIATLVVPAIVWAAIGFWMYKPWRLSQNIAFRAVWVVCLVILSVYLRQNIHDHNARMNDMSRNFYGVLSVSDATMDSGEILRSLWHGPIEHGNQVLSGELRRLPRTYYSPSSGIFAAVKNHPGRSPEVAGTAQPASGLNIGVVGLGSGTSACLAGPRDHVTFYEINPEIIRIAENDFFYLKDCRAQMVNKNNLRIELGDARITLERELKTKGSDQFDVLALDAFNGDAIPVHLLTRESFAMYWKHLRPDGILAINISNLHLDLAPVVQGLANEVGKKVILVSNDENAEQGAYATDWALVTSNERFLNDPIVRSLNNTTREEKKPIVWTDQYSNIVRVLVSFDVPDSWKQSGASDNTADKDED